MAVSWRRTACQVRKNPRSLTDTRMQWKHLAITITFQRTVTTPLTLCLSPGVHPIVHPPHPGFAAWRARPNLEREIGPPGDKRSDANVFERSRNLSVMA